jgi:hypothetical protein
MTTTPAFVSTVKADRTIEIPESIPVGSKVAVILLPHDEQLEESAARELRFHKVMDAIRAAINNNFVSPEISDKELNKRIREARQAAKAG